MRVTRTDRVPLTGARRTAAGVLIVPASVSRTGLQTYQTADGKTRVEFRPEQEVFAASALESLRGAVVTVGHVNEATPKGVGLVSDRDPTRAKRGEGAAQEHFVETSLMVTDPAVAVRVDAKELVEISLGYSADLDMTPGVTPDGRKYDAVQRNIQIHHAALLPVGQARAGKEARIRLDGNEELCFAEEQPPAPGRLESSNEPMKIKIGDRTFDNGGEEHIAFLNDAINQSAAALATAKTALDAATATATAEKARADGLVVQLDAAKKEAAAAIPAAIAAELAFRGDASPLLAAGYAFDGKSREQIMRDAIGTEACARADAQPEATRPVYLQVTFDQLKAAKKDGKPTYEVKVETSDSTNKPRQIGANAYADAHKDSK